MPSNRVDSLYSRLRRSLGLLLPLHEIKKIAMIGNISNVPHELLPVNFLGDIIFLGRTEKTPQLYACKLNTKLCSFFLHTLQSSFISLFLIVIVGATSLSETVCKAVMYHIPETFFLFCTRPSHRSQFFGIINWLSTGLNILKNTKNKASLVLLLNLGDDSDNHMLHITHLIW